MQLHHQRRHKFWKVAGLIIVIGLAVLAFHAVQTYGLEPLRQQVERMGVWAPIGIVVLRGISILLPALPSTAYSLLAGSLLGFQTGVITIVISDLIFCQAAFLISRNYGRGPLNRWLGRAAMKRIEQFNQSQLERNFFLMTGLLMTGLFDFVSYAIGLGGTSWSRFAPALFLSVIVSDPPIVALGAGLLDGGRMVLGFAVLGIFILALISALTRRMVDENSSNA